ncbi:MAG: hypothetical protein JXJ04_21355 [Spirochaetales bacterium]|nr:hypothetical protein [Spirochaetales bacterium]
MKKSIILSIIFTIGITIFCYAVEAEVELFNNEGQSEVDEIDSDLFDIPDDTVIDTEDVTTFTEETFSLYGYLVNYFAVELIFSGNEFDSSSVGNVSYLRLKADWNPGENLAFHAEVSYDAKFGNQNPYLLYETYGMVPAGYQANFPMDDFVQSFTFDHFYGKLNIWKFDIQFGKMPIAWGTGYAFNPTQKVSLAPFMDTISEETPGTYGIAPSLSIISGLSLEGYLAFQDKSHKTTSVLEDGDWNNLPYGIKLLGILGSFDLSLSWIKEVFYGPRADVPGEYEHRRSYYVGTDFAGGIGDVGVYGEAALHLPQNEDETEFDFRDHEFKDLIEVACGFYYTLPVINVELRGEFYHQGTGVTDKAEYNLMDLFSGEKTLQGEDYLFFYLDKLFLDYFRISAAAFFNLHDSSWALIPVVAYDMYDNFQVELGSTFFFGDSMTEFSGEYDIDPLPESELIIDLIQPLVYLRCKLSF